MKKRTKRFLIALLALVSISATAWAEDITLNDDKTIAAFTMPENDVTVSYALVRDISVSVTVAVEDASQNRRFRVQNTGHTFQPVGLDESQVKALFTVHDDIENKNLTATTDYTVQIFAVNDDGTPVGTAMTLEDFTYAPGRYIAKAVATEGGNYDGTTEKSNIFTLFQGYEVTIPAGEYVTYFKDEALYVEDTDARLYTITGVNDDKATVAEVTTAPAETPLLVKNNAENAKTILLIPTTTADEVEYYSGFKGTHEATQINASDATYDRYAFNGKQFVWVKNPIDIAANRAWLEVPVTSAAAHARAISIVFDGEATGITTLPSSPAAEEWCDLDGRKLATKPTRKGVYIQNGKKVVIK